MYDMAVCLCSSVPALSSAQAKYQQCANGSVPVGTVMDAPYLFPPPLPTPPIGFEPLPTSLKGNHLWLEYFNNDTWLSYFLNAWYILSFKKFLHISILHFKKSCNNFGDFFCSEYMGHVAFPQPLLNKTSCQTECCGDANMTVFKCI